MENSEKNNNMLPIVVVFVVILALVGGAYWFGKSSFMQKSPKEDVTDTREVAKTPQEVRDGEPVSPETYIDTPSEENVEQPTEGTTTEESNESVIETLKLLFAQKYEKKVEDINITISKREGNYIIGGVSFAGEIGGGIVLAAKINGAWKIVFDGNGTWTCEVVSAVEFPSTLVPECWDETTMSNLDRTAN